MFLLSLLEMKLVDLAVWLTDPFMDEMLRGCLCFIFEFQIIIKSRFLIDKHCQVDI